MILLHAAPEQLRVRRDLRLGDPERVREVGGGRLEVFLHVEPEQLRILSFLSLLATRDYDRVKDHFVTLVRERSAQ